MSIADEMRLALTAAGLSAERQMQRPGISLGVVTNVNDEQKLNRVKCLPIENEQAEETDWCYVMAPLGGKECGQFFFPNVNDLVVLAYLGGDPHRPMVIGSFWNTVVKPPYTIQDGKVYNFSIKTPSGIELLFYDEPNKQKATLTLPSGTVLTIDDENQAVSLRDKGGENALEMDLKGGNLTLKAKQKLVLSAGETAITLEAAGSLTQKAKNTVSMQAANIEQKANAKVSVQGSDVAVQSNGSLNLQASGPAALKGVVVNIN